MNRGDGLGEHQEFDMTGALDRYVCVCVCVCACVCVSVCAFELYTW